MGEQDSAFPLNHHCGSGANVPPQSVEALQRLLSLCERERKLISLELHDGCAQRMSASVMYVDLALSQLPHEPAAAKASVTEAVKHLRTALEEMRSVIHGIRPPALEQAGVGEALRELVTCGNYPQLAIELKLRLNKQRWMPTLELAVYRIVQESLQNALLHSGSPRAVVTVESQDDEILVEIRDFGRGFDRRRVPAARLGLTGLEQRASLVGGRCEIKSVLGEGTIVRAYLPRIDAQLEVPG